MCMCVVLVYFLTLSISIFEKKIVEGNKHRCVNETSRDKGGACANEKRKRYNQISSEITIGRIYPSAGYTVFLVGLHLVTTTQCIHACDICVCMRARSWQYVFVYARVVWCVRACTQFTINKTHVIWTIKE